MDICMADIEQALIKQNDKPRLLLLDDHSFDMLISTLMPIERIKLNSEETKPINIRILHFQDHTIEVVRVNIPNYLFQFVC